MVRLEEMSEEQRKRLLETSCPTFKTMPWIDGPPLRERRVAIVSTAGIHSRGDRPFSREPGDFYRVIPADIEANDLVMSHLSVNFDRTGFQQDWNVIFPIDRLRELAGENIIGSIADFHYSFMGAHDSMLWEKEARQLAGIMKKEGVNTALLVPV